VTLAAVSDERIREGVGVWCLDDVVAGEAFDVHGFVLLQRALNDSGSVRSRYNQNSMAYRLQQIQRTASTPHDCATK